jgi:hypothetical protein
MFHRTCEAVGDPVRDLIPPRPLPPFGRHAPLLDSLYCRHFFWLLEIMLRLQFRDPRKFGSRRLVIRILRHELPPHGEVQDRLAQGLDLVGARCQRCQRIEGEAGGDLEGFGIGSDEAGEARRRQPVAHRLAAHPLRRYGGRADGRLCYRRATPPSGTGPTGPCTACLSQLALAHFARGAVMSNLDEWARGKGFGEFCDVRTRTKIADVVPPESTCGIYILEFANGESYIGQSRRIPRRFVEHKRNHADIVRIAWKPVPPPNQDEEERRLVRECEEDGFLTRDKALADNPMGTADLNEVVTPDEQKSWLDSDVLHWDVGERYDDERTRRKNEKKFEKVRCGDDGVTEAQEFAYEIALLKAYICGCIPFPGRTEFRFWSLSVLSTKWQGFQTYYRINIGNQEVFALGYINDEELSGVLRTYVYASKKVIIDLIGRDKFPFLILSPSPWQAGGWNQIQVNIESIQHGLALLHIPLFRKACKTFNLAMMRKRKSLWAKSHCFQVVDRVVAAPPPRYAEGGMLLDSLTGELTNQPCDLSWEELATGVAPAASSSAT